MPSNEKMLSDYEYEMAMKSLNLSNIGAHVLEPTVANRYVRAMVRETSIFRRSRIQQMPTQVYKVHGVDFKGRLLEPGVEEQPPEYKAPVWRSVQLVAEEKITGVPVTDQAIRRSIERQNTVSTVLAQAGAKIGRDWEAMAVHGIKDGYPNDPLLNSQDGWIEKTNTKLFSGTDFDYEKVMEEGKVTSMLKAMIQEFDREYIGNRNNLSFELPPDIYDLYLDEMGERPTTMGDNAWTQYQARPYRQVAVNEAPVLEDSVAAFSSDSKGLPVMLNYRANLVYGVFHEITMEDKREADLRRTKFITTMEVDQGLAEPDVGVVAFLKE